MMQIAGIQKLTLVDFPGKVAATVFTRGCSFRCQFCHNPELVIPEKFNPLVSNDHFYRFLESRLGKIEGVCITGGEPTIQSDIKDFISHIKALGFAVKLDTNGSRPSVLEQIINDGDVDYIAMDIKSPLEKYPMVTNFQFSIFNFQTPRLRSPQSHSGQAGQVNSKSSKNSKRKTKNEKLQSSNPETDKLLTTHYSLLSNIMRSIKLIMSSSIDYEFRTTAVKPLLKVKDFEDIGKMIKGAKRYFIQNFQKSKHINEDIKFAPFSEKELSEAVNIIKKYSIPAKIR